MNDKKLQTRWFAKHRAHLRAVATRMVGAADADDAVQEAWLRADRADPGEITNPRGWLVTIVARVCLDLLRARKPSADAPEEEAATDDAHATAEAVESVGAALAVVLETLAPAERVAFVLHDLFGRPFEEIAPIVDRSIEATRQLASRARRRVAGADAAPDRERQRELVTAFLTATQKGDFAALLAVLDPDAVVRADRAAAAMGADAEIRGADAIARAYSGRARVAKLALIDGVPGVVWSQSGEPKVAFRFTFSEDRISGFVLSADGIGEMTIAIL